MIRIAVLGAGTAGTTIANRLARRYADELSAGGLRITVVDQDNRHVYQPGLLFLPFGDYTPDQITKKRSKQLLPGITFTHATIDRIDTQHDAVELADGQRIPYDVLVIASGSRTVPESIEGMKGEGWEEKVFDWYDIDSNIALRDRLERMRRGRLVVQLAGMPIKCPGAPIEFAFLADAYFTQTGVREDVTITYVTSQDAAFGRPALAQCFAELLEEKGVGLVTGFETARVDGRAGRLVARDGREVAFDVLASVPPHYGADFVARTPGLGDGRNFVHTDMRTLQCTLKPNIFALGDAANLPTTKGGAVAHFEMEVAEGNIARYLKGEPLDPGYDGHANGFIETGFERAFYFEHNYDTEPMPGAFPIPAVGPLNQMQESHLNHLGRRAIRWMYWNVLLPGHDMPGVTPTMQGTAKRVGPLPVRDAP
ncbi:MAG TPA: FAD/NAD(P)-binding oxidoreductase [Gemmatimonadales bacterium]|nr:FAD/NAD(P)-binding oxidoreductase [Gemmatimonadales bacterium]